MALICLTSRGSFIVLAIQFVSFQFVYFGSIGFVFSILNLQFLSNEGGELELTIVGRYHCSISFFSIQHSLQHSPIFQFVFRLYLDLVSLSFTVYSFMGHVFLSRSSRSSKRRGVSEPSAAKAQLTDHGMGLEPISSCSSRTASRKADVPVRYIHQRFTWFT